MNLSGLNQAMLRHFGEPVTLPGGVVVIGIVDLPRRGVALGASRAATAPPPDLPLDQPRMALLSEEAAGLMEKDVIVARGVAYAVVRPLPDGAGMTLVELTPAQEAPASPDEWR